MYRSMLLLPVFALVGGCINEASSPGKLPVEAASGIYTNANPQTVAACIAGVLGSTPQTEGNRIVVASVRNPDLRYSIGPNPKNAVYPTQIAVIGQESDSEETKRVDACGISGVRE